jgi:uncharacterized protein YneF (UPF0154 family)
MSPPITSFMGGNPFTKETTTIVNFHQQTPHQSIEECMSGYQGFGHLTCDTVLSVWDELSQTDVDELPFAPQEEGQRREAHGMGDDDFNPDIVNPSDWDPEIVPSVDADTGLSTGIAAAEGAILGVSLSTIALVVGGAFVCVLLIGGLAPLFISVPPPEAPHLADAMQDPISEDALRALAEAAGQKNSNAKGPSITHDPNYPTIDHDPNYPTISSDSSKIISNANPVWEQELQAQRLAASPRDWPSLVEKHRKIYRKLGVDPCTSGFFPEGCSQ